MSYGKFHYEEIKNAPTYLKDLGIKPVFVPRQDGYREHYAFLDNNEATVYACSELSDLVKEGEEIFKKSNSTN